MKKALIAMALMAIIVVPFGGLWTFVLRPVIGGGVEQSFIYPIYVGLIVLAGIIAGSASILYDEIRAMRKELDELKKAEKGARDTE